jgi:hypothetical protein
MDRMTSMTEQERQEKLAEAARAAQNVHRILDEIAKAEPNHGYASIGGAYDKMVRKATRVAQDIHIMRRLGSASGSQRIAG